jgi:hypothetical protein
MTGGPVEPSHASTVRDGMEYEEEGDAFWGRPRRKAGRAPLTLKRPASLLG